MKGSNGVVWVGDVGEGENGKEYETGGVGEESGKKGTDTGTEGVGRGNKDVGVGGGVGVGVHSSMA